MNKKLHINNWKRITAIAAFLLLFMTGIFAANDLNQVIITGQVTNSKIGNPIENQKIHIISTHTNTRSHNYNNSIYTNKEGIYTDTIYTTLNSGSFLVTTTDIRGNQFESTIHFRFISPTNQNLFVIDFSVDSPQPEPTMQARFKYVQKSGGDHLSFKFFDLSDDNMVKRRHWDFGDGRFSALKNPEHLYEKPGLYKVKLTIYGAIDREISTSEISKLIYIPEINYSHMGGHCFAGYFPIDEGKAILYLIENENSLRALDTAMMDTLGYYYFYQVPDGEYCVKAQPDKRSSAYGNMIPTYYGNEPYWQKADVVNHAQTNWEYDINLVESKKSGSGPGELSGKVSLTGLSRQSETDLAAGIDMTI